MRQGGNANKRNRTGREEAIVGTVPRSTATIGGFIKKAQQNILENTWQVIQVSLNSALTDIPETNPYHGI